MATPRSGALNRDLSTIVEYLRDHHGNGSLASVAAAFGLSPRGLNRLFEAHGSTFIECRSWVREAWMRLLIAKGIPLDQIAEVVGFASGRAARRFWKDRTGQNVRRKAGK